MALSISVYALNNENRSAVRLYIGFNLIDAVLCAMCTERIYRDRVRIEMMAVNGEEFNLYESPADIKKG